MIHWKEKQREATLVVLEGEEFKFWMTLKMELKEEVENRKGWRTRIRVHILSQNLLSSRTYNNNTNNTYILCLFCFSVPPNKQCNKFLLPLCFEFKSLATTRITGPTV